MSIQTIFETFEQYRKDLDLIKKRIRDDAHKKFHEATNEIFALYPEIESFSWTQYTPYFNDGDTCQFSVHTDSLTFNDMDPYEPVDENGEWMDWYTLTKKKNNGEPLTRLQEAYLLIHRLISVIDEDAMKDIFGDHAQITVTRNGVSADYYDHD